MSRIFLKRVYMKIYLTRLIQGSDNIEITLKDWHAFYQRYCKSDHFIDRVKKPCLEYFEYKCFACGEKAITAHHSKIGYLHLWQEEIPKHVIAVCQSCHQILHDKFKPYSKKPKTAIYYGGTIVIYFSNHSFYCH